MTNLEKYLDIFPEKKAAGDGSKVNSTACRPLSFASTIRSSSALCPLCIPSNFPMATAEGFSSQNSVVPEIICMSSQLSFPKNNFTGPNAPSPFRA